MLEINKIYNQNCLEGIKKIEDETIDLIVTDPPYCIGTTSNGKQGTWNDNNLVEPFFEILFSELKRVLKDGAAMYINTDWRTYPFLYPILKKYFEIPNLIVWDYEWIKCGGQYRFSHEFIIYAIKGKRKRTFSASERDVWRIKPINWTLPTKLHNAQKPVALVEKMLLNSSAEGDIVLDTFIGSGTTAEACIRNNRNYIGFEIDEHYYKITQDRINNL